MLSFPDVNVWLALLLEDHVHREPVRKWWETDQSDVIGFIRLTQMSVLRLLTTAAAMNGHPLTMPEAWAAYDRLFADDRVAFLDEPRGVEPIFRSYAPEGAASPKLWADAWLLAFGEQSNATIITFDRALSTRARDAILLA